VAFVMPQSKRPPFFPFLLASSPPLSFPPNLSQTRLARDSDFRGRTGFCPILRLFPLPFFFLDCSIDFFTPRRSKFSLPHSFSLLVLGALWKPPLLSVLTTPRGRRGMFCFVFIFFFLFRLFEILASILFPPHYLSLPDCDSSSSRVVPVSYYRHGFFFFFCNSVS